MQQAIRIVVAAAVVLCWVIEAQAQPDSVVKGRQLAERLCAGCHLNKGQGEKIGPHGIPGFVAVANRSHQTPEGIVKWLKSLPPMMPNHHLTQDEMYALSDFIMSLRKE